MLLNLISSPKTVSASNKLFVPFIPLLNPGTSLLVSKAGDNVSLNWTGTGTLYNGVAATDKKFLNNYLLFQNLTATSFTYTNALINSKEIEFFDVTDETETNRGEDGNGQLPPPPPEITTISSLLFIGGAATITGNNFSEVPGDNNICFAGGVCIKPDTANSTQLDFIVPPSAISGPIWVNIGQMDSNAVLVDIKLEDSSTTYIMRTLGFSIPTSDYWTGASLGGTNNRFYRLYYDDIQKKWLRDERQGTYASNILYCSTKTDSAKRIYCAVGSILPLGVGASRFLQTNTSANLQNCIDLGGTSGYTNVRGAAADPNPNAEPGRDAVYFAVADDWDPPTYHIKKVAAGCGAIMDDNYGETNWYGSWNAIVGMAVNPSNGDLYVAEPKQIMIVHPDESISIFKTGFSNIYNIDVWREPGSASGYVVVADNGASLIKAIPLDNTFTEPIEVSPASTARAVAIGWTTYSTWDWNTSDLIRLTIAHNDGQSSVPKLRDEPFLIAEPYDNTPEIWISSPDVTDLADHQSRLRPSTDPSSLVYSTVKIVAYWKDGYSSRTICAIMGDPMSFAPYEPAPSPIPAGCTHPWKDPVTGSVYGPCDNHEDFAIGAVGSPPDGATDLLSCKTNCGANSSNACIFEFQITQRYAGDNYRVYFWIPDNPWSIKSTTLTAWKRVHIEQDKMCRRGGMLWEDPAREPDAQPNDGAILISKYNTARVDDLHLNDIIDIFDSLRPYEGTHDIACVIGIDDTYSSDFVIIILGEVSGATCLASNYYLLQSYDGSVPNLANPLPNKWDFTIGESAGVCVDAQGYFQADSSRLNKRDKTGPFDDGFVSFKEVNSGRSVLPYLPPSFFAAIFDNSARFHQKWFSNKDPFSCYIEDPINQCINCCNNPHNYYHIAGASDDPNARGETLAASDISLVYMLGAEDAVNSYCGSNPCTGNETGNYIRRTSAHELAHQFRINLDLPCQEGHDTNNAWCGGPGSSCVSSIAACNPSPPNPMVEWCLMNETNDPFDLTVCQRSNGIDRMECSDLSAHYIPGQPSCTETNCSGGVSIRTNTDPE
ncbi:MAG: hypothetical protein A2Y62_21765 [Candidatus Fischerbacteria bacterium RBG_13_37_8]|uniref:IPT/TIG domain-containing protein n=1 Tax=Candidatus Fischerbacteria bacterium RBG_13_37_8 TaxID=1817863 RepID=A0A1F5VUQ8_9BACT|nr:MAG: hypothetical protein A2Y62_21765 [Candidatus Fischerbacteria bacterium RBG_13_37_8]